MVSSAPQEIFLKDYRVPDFEVDQIQLHFELDDVTTVSTKLVVHRNPKGNGQASLILNGERGMLSLQSVILDGNALDETGYQLNDETLTISDVPDQFTLEIVVTLKPADNTRLSGLYQSRTNLCTQCESHGFRRITYFFDRPDVMTYFTTTITADPERYPYLLSNGNLFSSEILEDGRKQVVWQDPSLKPCYLFALVAGDFDLLEDSFVTRSGREVALQLFIEKGDLDQSGFAMQALKQSMKWDEETFDREYDLDIFMIVAVSDFNYGAMENKGLNIFNTKYILARPDTATDTDYINIQGVIGHEYFHNWSGNRITCRDWFQISLKEGLTVFRDQRFTADMTDPAVKRIQDANIIRSVQFAQDAGPMAHPIRPDAYIEVSNFYTVTVYNKGAEVIRMIATMLGNIRFRKALNLYFDRHDGQAVTTEDFVKAMEDSSGVDLGQFRRWYDQAGTPTLTVKGDYDAGAHTYTLKVEQSTPATPGQTNKKPFHIPLKVSLFNQAGETMTLYSEYGHGEAEMVLPVRHEKDTFMFEKVSENPVPSLLRGFSAPVKLKYEYADQELLFLLKNETDDFNRWDAGQKLAQKRLFALLTDHQAGRALSLDTAFVKAWGSVLMDDSLSPLFKAQALALPNLRYLMGCQQPVDILGLHGVREFMRKALAEGLQAQWQAVYESLAMKPYQPLIADMGERSLRNVTLAYLSLLDGSEWSEKALSQYHSADNLTDQLGALVPLMDIDCIERTQAIEAFYKQSQSHDLVLDRWFALQAGSQLPNTLEIVKGLLDHKDFTYRNPNRVRALIGTFTAQNLSLFHSEDGSGYEFLADQILMVDQLNPQVAARLMEPLTGWRQFDEHRQVLMKKALERLNAEKLSKDVFEIVSKSLL